MVKKNYFIPKEFIIFNHGNYEKYRRKLINQIFLASKSKNLFISKKKTFINKENISKKEKNKRNPKKENSDKIYTP